MIKAIIFDFDGVILESASLKTDAFRELFENEARCKEIIDYHLKFLGHSRYVKFRYIYENILNRPYSDDIEQALADKFSSLVWARVLTVKPVTGAIEFLKQSKLAHFIASGTPESELKEVVKKRDLSPYFKEIHGSPRKKPEIIEDILQRNGLSRSEVIFIGDGTSDRDSAEICKLNFIARLTKENGDKLKECFWKIDDLVPLNSVVAEINNATG